MREANTWVWDEEKTKRWMKPAIEIPYLAGEWKSRGLTRFLDSGCGPGRHALYFAEQGFTVTALDKSPEGLARLRAEQERRGLTLEVVEGNIFSMPFPGASFDCILDYNVSYHTDTAGYSAAVAELRRVLRPGGEVYLTLLSRSDPGFLSAPAEIHVDRYTLRSPGGTPHFYAGREDLPALFAGFTPVIPIREIRTAAIDSGRDSNHFHLLLRRDAPSAGSDRED